MSQRGRWKWTYLDSYDGRVVKASSNSSTCLSVSPSIQPLEMIQLDVVSQRIIRSARLLCTHVPWKLILS